MTTVNVSSISGRTVQVSYLGAYTGTVYPSVTMVSPITDDPASVAYQTTHPVVAGDIFEWDDVNGLNVSVDSSGLVSADIEGSFQGRWFDDGDQVYGDWEAYTFAVPVADTVPDQFSVGANVTGAEPGATVQRTFVLAGIDPGETVSPSATGSATVSPGTAQAGDTITVELTAGTFEAVVSGGVTINGVSDSFSVTSRAAVLPTLDVTLPDLSLGETDAVSIDLNNYFSGASSYTLTGLPAGSGLSFSGSVLSGNVNKEDIAGSPFTLTVAAFGAEGSIQDVFNVTVLDDIKPVITLSGPSTITVLLGETYTDQGAIATDSVDGSMGSVTGVGTVDTNTVGQYTITYPGAGVVDAAGNVAEDATRIVNVVAQLPTAGRGLKQALKVTSLKKSLRQPL